MNTTRTMKILFFIPSLLSGGAERVLAIIANELAIRGHNVTLAYNFSYPVQYELNPQIHLVDLMRGKSKDKMSNHFLKTICLMRNIRRITKGVNPEVVITFMVGMNRYVIPSLRFTKYPVIASEHTTVNEEVFPTTFFNHFTRWHINKWATCVTVLTPYDKEYLACRLRNVVVMPNPLSFEPIDASDFARIDSQRKNILACGRIDRYKVKGLDQLILNFVDFAHQHPDCDLDILGDGDHVSRDYLQSLINKQHLEGRVHLIGYSSDVKSIMLQHKYFVLSSKTEGFSMVLLEAMACGCACICFDCISGPRSIIHHGMDGLLVKDQDFSELMYAMGRVVSDDTERKYLAKNAIRSVLKYSVSNIVEQWEKLIREVVS